MLYLYQVFQVVNIVEGFLFALKCYAIFNILCRSIFEISINVVNIKCNDSFFINEELKDSNVLEEPYVIKNDKF